MNRITATLLCLMLCLAGTSLHATAFAAEQTSVSAPSAPSPATRAQVVALKTSVVPTPLIRPFPAPVVTRTVTVPTSIDATGTTVVTTALNDFIATVPDGSIISFPVGATYLLKQVEEWYNIASIYLVGRHNLIFEGNGATLRVDATAAGDNAYTSPFFVGDGTACTDIVIHDFILIGNSPTPGIFNEDSQSQAGVHAGTATRLEVYNITSSATPGDFLNTFGTSKDVWVHDCHILTAGRQGVSVVGGSDILVENCAFDVSGYHVFDVEPDTVDDVCSNVTFRNCTAGTYGNRFFVIYDMAEAAIDQVTVDNNTVTGGSLKTLVTNGGTVRMTRISFTNNKGTTAAGPALNLSYVDGLTVTGNVQPLSSGVLASITDCTEAGTS